jgi:glycosyltransferase involved in cell wall biosynthesis
VVDISVVIPTFRRPALLKEAIASALAQERVFVEVIVVDDSPEGSARATVEACADSRIIYLRHDPPSGGRPALVRNTGWPYARGRFIHFLDDDDRVADGFYKCAVDAFEAHPTLGAIVGRIEPFGGPDIEAMRHELTFFSNAGRRARLAARIRSRLWMVASLLFRETLFVNSACMVRRECVAAVNGYDPEISLNEDVDFICRAIRTFGFAFLDRIVLHYRILPDSLMHGRTGDQKLVESYQRMYAKYKAAHGAAELLAMKVLSHTLLRVL